MSPRARFAVLAAILVSAAVFRFVGLSAGLRHATFIDEQFFVMNVEGMLDRGDLDHRFHMYPGFFFYLLTPALAFVQRPFGADAYLVGRHVVAAFGVAAVALVFVLGTRLAGARAGLIGAAVLAASPVAVAVAHEVRPDVALSFFALLALLGIDKIDGSRKRDILAGLAVGMATAIKYTGVTLAVPYVVRRLTVHRDRVRGMLLAGAFSLVAYAALSPYSFLHFNEFREGVLLQKEYHDMVPARGVQSYFGIASVYFTSVLPGGVGTPALLAALGALWLRRREWRNLVPLAALPVAMIAVLSTAQIHRARYILASMGAVAVLAGIGVDAVWKRSRALGAAACLIVLLVPLERTVKSVAAFQRPGTMDRVLDWSSENLPDGSRIATTLPRLGFGIGRVEVMPLESWDATGRRTASHADVVIAAVVDGRPSFPGFARRFVALPSHPLEGPPLEVLIRESPELVTAPIDLKAARFDASENAPGASLAADGDLGTRWETEGTQRPGMWVSVDFKTPRMIDRVELLMGKRPNQWGRVLELEVSQNGRDWISVKTTPGRAMVPDQVEGDRGRVQSVLLVTPTRASAVRIKVSDTGQPRWGFAEIDIEELISPLDARM